MRVRTAKVTVDKAAGLETLFDHAVDRHLAWVIGTGKIYADLEKVAKRHGYRVWTPEDKEFELWVAVRNDLIAEDSWDGTPEGIEFEASKPGLGTVSLVSGDGNGLFDNRKTVSLVGKHETVEHGTFTYTERLYSVNTSLN